MSKSVYYPADTIDAGGNVYPTVGENIRYGEKNSNYFGLKWKKATITLNNGVITESGIVGAAIFGENRDQIIFDKPITIINFNVTFLEKNTNMKWKPLPQLKIYQDGGFYIVNTPETYRGLLMEFQYRELK